MKNVDIIKQKIKGKLQKAEGEIQQGLSSENNEGMKFKGGLSKIKGETNEAVADIKNKINKVNNKSLRKKNKERII